MIALVLGLIGVALAGVVGFVLGQRRASRAHLLSLVAWGETLAGCRSKFDEMWVARYEAGRTGALARVHERRSAAAIKAGQTRRARALTRAALTIVDTGIDDAGEGAE